MVRPGLHVDPDLVLVALQSWPGPTELHTDVVVVVVVMSLLLLGTDPTHDTPIRDQGGGEQSHLDITTPEKAAFFFLRA